MLIAPEDIRASRVFRAGWMGRRTVNADLLFVRHSGEAGIQCLAFSLAQRRQRRWIPAFAGMTRRALQI
jgi:hypothetical protein